MARRRIREFDTKRLISEQMEKASYGKINYAFQCLQIAPDTDLDVLERNQSWLTSKKLVVKPDMLFGKRGKSKLILLDATWEEAKRFIKGKMGKEAEVEGLKGTLNYFIVEPFVPHLEEFYLSIVTKRNGDLIRFSEAGGIEVEKNWEKMKEIPVAIGMEPALKEIEDKLADLDEEKRSRTSQFILACYRIFRDLDFSLLEFNPFTFDSKGNPFPLDGRGELDDTAEFKNRKRWGKLEFPRSFGRKLYPEEKFISDLDSKSGASLKLTVLNPHGRIWTMVAGGGASVIYTDTIVDLGMGKELANYGEYSGNPNTEETYQYAKTVLDLATREPDGKPRALIIGGGIANFTDVAKTFTGIIQALREYSNKIKKSKMRIYIRRGGPNYEKGLDLMRKLGKELDLHIDVYGPEAHMTKIVPMAIKYVKKGA